MALATGPQPFLTETCKVFVNGIIPNFLVEASFFAILLVSTLLGLATVDVVFLLAVH
jgi:hypothetical protein